MTSDPDIGVHPEDRCRLHGRDRRHSAQAGFPVISPDGSPAGVTGVSKLARVPAASRVGTTLGQVMDPVSRGYLAVPEDPAAPLAGGLAAIVISDGRITGIVTVSRLRQIIRQEALRAASAQ
jgi:hypothetical protein